MATIIVNTTLDENDGSIADGDVSLRDAIAAANNGDTITFASGDGEAFENGGTIRLSQDLGELVIASDLTIDGDLDDDGAPDVTVTGDTLGDDETIASPLGNTITDAINNAKADDNVRVFNVTGGSSTIDGLVITGGYVGGRPGNGGGIYVREEAAISIINSDLSGNIARHDGGLSNRGTATLTNTTVSSNFASWAGGGIQNDGTLKLSNTTVSGNSASVYGGGIENDGTATLTNTTVSGNHASSKGGGINNWGTATLTNTTVSDNFGYRGGGGIFNDGTATLSNTTMSGNSSDIYGGGILNWGTATLTNTIVLGNSAPEDPEISGRRITETSPNIIGGRAADVFAETVDNDGVSAGRLADNGGTVPTIALRPHPDNPALDAGQDDRLDESVTGIDLNGDGDTDDVIDTDARGSGFPRSRDLPSVANNGENTVDLGALEAESVVANTAPEIVSPATVSVPEIQNSVLDVESTDDFDAEDWGLTYAITGGADAPLFNLDAATGVLSFVSAPDLENPDDVNGDNDYGVQVTVTDSGGLTDVQDITVTVTDAIEVQPQTFAVATADDERDNLDGLGTVSLENFGGADDLSLREALALAEQIPFRPDTITFASGPGEAFESGGTIRLSQALGELVIASDLTIDGDLDDDGAPDVTVTGDTLGDDLTTTDAMGNIIADGTSHQFLYSSVDNVRVLNVTNGSSTIDGLVITGGCIDRLSSRGDGGGVYVAEDAALTITHSSVSGNSSRLGCDGEGGGIWNAGVLKLSHTVVSHNFGTASSGGIHNNGIATLTNTTVSGNHAGFCDGRSGGIHNNGIATLTNTTVSDNSATKFGGISNYGTATLAYTTVSGNSADWWGGGIVNSGTATLTNTTVSGNRSVYQGAGIHNDDTGMLTLTNTTVSANSTYGPGGGIDNDGIATLTNTTVSGNGGGGIANRGTASLTNVTVAGNFVTSGRGFSPDGGGGINNSGNVTLTNVTVTGNVGGTIGFWEELAGSGGGILNKGTATLTNTIVLGNTAPDDPEISGTITEDGLNLIGGGAADVFAETVEIDPPYDADEFEAGVLADNGGAVKTVALKSGVANPALDAGQDDRLDERVVGIDLNGDGDTDDVIDTDGRGDNFGRFADQPDVANNGANTVDLGAFEFDGATVANMAPVIVSAATILVPPDFTRVLDVESTDDFDAEGEGLTYAKTGGVDAALLNLDATSGALTFVSAPAFENPGDSNGDNDYEVQVTVTDSGGLSDVQDMVVTVSTEFPTFVVTTADDERDDLDGLGTVSLENFGGADDLSLREALALADESPLEREVITFASDPGAAFEDGGTIRLGRDLGELVMVSDVSIDGDIDDDGAPDVTVTGDTLGNDETTTDPLGNTITDVGKSRDNSSDNVRVFDVRSGFAKLDGLVITGGVVRNYLAADGSVHVAEGATLALSNSSVSGNYGNDGGGVANDGTLAVSDTTLSGNSADTGSGVFNRSGGIATLTNLTVSGNANGPGGVIANRGTATLTNATVSGNSYGIANDASWATLTMTNITISGNQYGYGIENRGTLTLANSIVSSNIDGLGIENRGTLTLANSIVLGNEDDIDDRGTITELGSNIIGGDARDVFAETVDNEGVAGVLADNGGAVQTIALNPHANNPALDAGQDDRLDESVVGVDLNGDGDMDDVIDTDARGDGFERFADQPDVANNGANTVDLGAYEVPAEDFGGPDPDRIPVTVTFKGEDAWYSSAFGMYDQSTMEADLLAADIGETADGAVLYEAELTEEQLDNLGFFLLSDGARWNADLASLVGEDLMVVETAAGYAVSFDGVPLSGRGAPAFFSDASLNPGGVDHFVEDGTPEAYCLSVEDLAGGGDKDFDDALFLVEAGVPKTGAEVTATFEGESAFFHNTFGYFNEATGEAEIIFAHMDETTLPPGTTETFDLTAEEYDTLEFFLIPDGGRKNADLFSDLDALDLIVEEVNGGLQARDQATGTVLEGFVNPVYVPEKAGNPDAVRHALQIGDVDDFELRWEDLPDGGDADYDDTVVSIETTPGEVLL